MNNPPILKSKLIMPELPASFLMTDRLKNLHQKMNHCRAAIISAPAGYGKTTLTVSYFNYHTPVSFRVCWYRLDQEDNKPSVFINHLIEALFPEEISEFAESRKTISSNLSKEFESANVLPLICNEMWTYHQYSQLSRSYIVLDDFQYAAQNQDITDVIRYLFDNLPPSFSFLILTRGNTEIFTEKQKLEKNVLNIKMEELAFTEAEIENIITKIVQPYTENKLAQIIAASTEGWIAGIILLCQSAKDKTSDISLIYPGKMTYDNNLFRYLSLEVFKSVENNTQDALARLALLQDFSEVEASEILEIGDIKSLMDKCMNFGMFIQKIPGSPVVYRFHSLFREFMLYILNSRYTYERIEELHLKAAQYYINHLFYFRAAEHISQCKDPSSALDIVINAGFNKLLIGEKAELKAWLDLLPDEFINLNPIILMYKAQLMPNSRQPEMIEPLQKAVRQSLNDNNLEIYFNLSSVLIYILVCNNNMKGLLEMTPDISNKLHYASIEMKNAMKILKIVRYMAQEQYTLAEAESESTLYNLLPEDSQWLYLILSSITYTCLGKLDKAIECMEKALVLKNFRNVEPARGFVLLFLSAALCMKNQHENLQANIYEILDIGKKYDYDYLSAYGSLIAAYKNYASLNMNASVEMLDNAIFHYNQISNKAMRAICKMLRLLWSLQKNNISQCLEEAQKTHDIIISLSPGLMTTEISQSILGAIARESGDFYLAERCLISAIEGARQKKTYQVLCGSLLHLSRLYFIQGNTEQGHIYLKQAMELADSNNYLMFWDIHIPTLTDMMLRSMRYGYSSDFARKLLCKFYNIETVTYLSNKIINMDENEISMFINGFTSTYKEEKYKHLYFVKATLFGKPEIYVNGTKITDTEWKTKKVSDFLYYLLLKSGNTITKENLAEILWPNSDSKSAIASQRTALYHLRKILYKYGVEVTGEKAFISETPGGLIIKNNDFLELDIHEFMKLYKELTSLNNSFQGENKTKILKKMISIYRGDLMEDGDYGDLVVSERERLKGIFIDACEKLSLIYINSGELGEAEKTLRHALTHDPCNENICLELLKLYMLQGRRNKAVKLYYNFKRRFEQELDLKVDNSLTEVIRNSKPEKMH